MSSGSITGGGMQSWIEALRDVAVHGPERGHRALDEALERTAATSRSLVHVSHDKRHGGALKASQTVSSEHVASGWAGTIAYADQGAHWELERGGEHAVYIDSLAHLSAEDFASALDQVVDGKL